MEEGTVMTMDKAKDKEIVTDSRTIKRRTDEFDREIFFSLRTGDGVFSNGRSIRGEYSHEPTRT